MTKYVWRLFRHPVTEVIVRVHLVDFGLARLYQRWGWVELRSHV